MQAIIHYLQKNYELAEQFASEARENKGPKKRFISQTIHEISERSRNAEITPGDPVPKATSGSTNSYPENYAVGAGTVYDNSYKNHVDYLKNLYNKELPVFYHTSPWQAALLDFFTLGLYSIYWFYKHWRMIQISTGEKLSPFLRAIFQIFFVFSLFKRIHNTAQIAHYSGFNSHAAFATIFVIVSLAGNAVSRVDLDSQSQTLGFLIGVIVLGVVGSPILYVAQKAANHANDNTLGANYMYPRVQSGEVIISGVGIVLFLLFLAGTTYALTENNYPRGTDSQISSQETIMDDLTAEYEACSADLNTRYELLDQTNGSAVDEYNADYDECETVRLDQNGAVERYNYLIGE